MSGPGRVAAVAVCLGVSLVLTASRSSRAGDEKEDKAQEALQGVYAFKAGSEDGVPDKDTSKDINVWQFVITGNELEVKPGLLLEKYGVYKGAGYKLKFRLDPKTRPRHFDVTEMEVPIPGGDRRLKLKGQAALGIYKFEKGELTIVYGSVKDRPSCFEGGKGRFKLVLVKQRKR
jgi:uncharacterized protein (TIGR03067 family)